MFKLTELIKGLFKSSGPSQGRSFKELFQLFQEILKLNSKILDEIARTNEILGEDYVFDRHFIETFVFEISTDVQKLIFALNEMVHGKYEGLIDAYQRIESDLKAILDGHYIGKEKFIIPYDQLKKGDEDSVGGKNSALCQIASDLNIKIPRGFAITFFAYKTFLSTKGLEEKIKTILNSWEKGLYSTKDAAQMIQNEIMNTNLPSDLKHAIKDAASHLFPGKLMVVRSSAYGEDSEHSFAGVFDSIIGVEESGILDAYKKVVASNFNIKAMEYRKQIDFKEDETLMAVGCQEFIDAKTSGVIYSLNPSDPASDTMIISSTWGLGGLLVSGQETGDTFIIDRKSKKISSVQLSWKEKQRKLVEEKNIKIIDVDESLKAKPSLSTEQVKQLADQALSIERYFKRPQDIEFAITEDDEIVILQSRPLTIKQKVEFPAKDFASLENKYKVLIKDQGTTAQEGVGIGEVYRFHHDEELKNVPNGAVVVTKFATPRLAPLVPKLSGIVTEIGAVTGHLATICREYSLPALFNVPNATKILEGQGLITLDATDRTIYKGEVKELFFFNLEQEDILESYEYRLLRRVLRKIEPLNLVDPADKNFRPEGCETFHDITRFVHEKAVEALVDLHFSGISTKDASIGRLKWHIPLDLVIIDVGGGLKDFDQSSSSTITLEQITSLPMLSLIKGLKHPGAWNNEPMSVDVSSFMASLTRTFSAEYMDPKSVGQNLAVISHNYLNLSLRLGYHFTMVDTYLSENIIENYIYFRFFGGVTESERRNRRAKMIQDVLDHYDFMVETKGDLVVGRLKRLDKKEMEKRLYLIGILIGFTRQLDVMMVNDQRIIEFENKIYQLMEDKNE